MPVLYFVVDLCFVWVMHRYGGRVPSTTQQASSWPVRSSLIKRFILHWYWFPAQFLGGKIPPELFYLIDCIASECSGRIEMKKQNKNSQCEYALGNVQRYDDTHQRISRQCAFPLSRVQSKTRPGRWRQIQNLPNPRHLYRSATFTNGGRPFKCADTLNDPT